MNTHPITYTIDTLHIQSLNCHKSYSVLLSLLNSTDPSHYDILCIQEPPPNINRYTSFSPPQWDRLVPSLHTETPNALMYINKTIPSSSYSQNTIQSSFITSITLTLDSHSLHIFSVYSPPESDDAAIHTLHHSLTSLFPLPLGHSFAVFGDFNKHHPLWMGPFFPFQTECSDVTTLINTMTVHGLAQIVKAGMLTFFLAPHNTWCSSQRNRKTRWSNVSRPLGTGGTT
jgi:hypothetical protein